MHLSQKELFKLHQAQTSHFPLMLEMEKAEGVYIYDTSGKKYIDLISGIAVSSLGHGNERVKQAIINQLNKHMHLMVYGEFVQAPQVRLAQKLTSLLPPGLNSVYLVNSGTEATEGALKLAKKITGRSEIIAFKQSYHGSTHASLSLNSEEYFKNGFKPLLPDVRFLDFNDTGQLTGITSSTACVIVETVRGESGYITQKGDFLFQLRKRCSEMGAILIFDEIQCGMGRTGKLFAFEHYGVIPDILLLGKALGAGMPIGAFVSSQHNMEQLADNPYLGHITTFGGHPVVAAAALAGIEELISRNLIEQVKEKEELFRSLLKHPSIKHVSGIGLMLGIEFENFEFNKKLIDACIDDGLITDWFLFASNKLRISPPLTIEKDEITTSCNVILKNIEKLCQIV